MSKSSISFPLLILICALYTTPVLADQLPLLSLEEIEQLNYSKNEWQAELDLYRQQYISIQDVQPYGSTEIFLKNKGPIVSIVDPEAKGDHYRASIPLKLLIYLKGRQAPIDLETLKVKGKRGIFSLNITDRIKTFLRESISSENADYVIDAKIPKLGAGHYLVVLSLADIDGNQEEVSAFIEVFEN